MTINGDPTKSWNKSTSKLGTVLEVSKENNVITSKIVHPNVKWTTINYGGSNMHVYTYTDKNNISYIIVGSTNLNLYKYGEVLYLKIGNNTYRAVIAECNTAAANGKDGRPDSAKHPYLDIYCVTDYGNCMKNDATAYKTGETITLKSN
ncbi:MAG: hypothetical protein IJN50_06495 [Clostridia bacterium]|nr:hypothetical protein [Clostridia bacterium]